MSTRPSDLKSGPAGGGLFSAIIHQLTSPRLMEVISPVAEGAMVTLWKNPSFTHWPRLVASCWLDIKYVPGEQSSAWTWSVSGFSKAGVIWVWLLTEGKEGQEGQGRSKSYTSLYDWRTPSWKQHFDPQQVIGRRRRRRREVEHEFEEAQENLKCLYLTLGHVLARCSKPLWPSWKAWHEKKISLP